MFAEALREWLPLILQTAKPFMSATDIDKGARGLDEVSGRLEMRVGISCLTPENMDAPWILYEAGALSKTINDKTRLCTYLLGGLRPQDVKPPLGMFQATNPNKQDTQKLVRTINRAVSNTPVPEINLDRLFERMWPDLEAKLAAFPEPPKSGGIAVAKRSADDMVAEILEIARRDLKYQEALLSHMTYLQKHLERVEVRLVSPSTLSTLAASGQSPFLGPIDPSIAATLTAIADASKEQKADVIKKILDEESKGFKK